LNPIIRKVAGAVSWASKSWPLADVMMDGKIVKERGMAPEIVGEAFPVPSNPLPGKPVDNPLAADDEDRLRRMFGIE
jgi:hypothetical protein